MKAINRSLILTYVCAGAMVLAGMWLLVSDYRDAGPHATLIPSAYSSLPVTATPLMQCEALHTGCRRALLAVINADRAAVGAGPLALDWTMTYGAGSCIGAAGHAKHMALTGQLSHDQFPADVCAPFTGTLSENVGASPAPELWGALLQIHELMESEPYTPGCLDNHHCSLLYAGFRHIGIGYRRGGGALYLTETFSG